MGVRTYRAKLALRSAVATTWQADTIFGHLCWVLRYTEGEGALRDLLGQYAEGRPPLVLSNGFPGDLLPRPLVLGQPERAGGLAERRARAREAKAAAETSYLSLEEFNRVLSGESVLPAAKWQATERSVLKNQINRLSATTGGEGGQLYEFAETYSPAVSIYLRVADGEEERAERLLKGLAEMGYGKRKSVGYGELGTLEFAPFEGFAAPDGANGFVALSDFVPAAGDPTDGAWRTVVKYGKLGEEYAVEPNPFKRPLLMLATGSCFRSQPVRDYYGRLVSGISVARPEVVQYGLAFALPMRL